MNVPSRLRESQSPILAPAWVRWATLIIVGVFLVMAPLSSAPYVNFDRSMVMVFTIVGLGLNLLTGFTGQISLGHGAFFALGAYTAAILINELDWHYLSVVPVVAVLVWVLGYLIGRPILRLHGLQLALVTMALALVTPSVIKRFDHVTNGQEGIGLDIATPPGWTGLDRDQWVYYLCLTAVVLALVVSRRLSSGRVGRSLVAIRDNEPVASTLGIRSATTKTYVFALSAAFAGVAGVMYTYVVQFVAPDAFGLTLAVAFITLIVVGGLGSTYGAIFGAIFVVYVPDLAGELNQSAAGLSYGMALVVFMFVLPFGMTGLVRAGLNPLLNLMGSRRAASTAPAAGSGR